MSAFIVSERIMHRAVHALMPQDARSAACDEMDQPHSRGASLRMTEAET
jgi:hypothetical protein